MCLLAAIGLFRERGGGGPAVESNEAFFGLVGACLRGSSGQNGKNTHKECLSLPFRPSLPRNGYRRITDSASVFLAIVFGTLTGSKRFSYGIFCSLRSPIFYRFAPGLSLLANCSLYARANGQPPFEIFSLQFLYYLVKF